MRKGLSYLIILLCVIGQTTFIPSIHSNSTKNTGTYTLWHALPMHISSVLEEQIDAFEVMNPNIDIETTIIDPEEFREKYFDSFPTGNVPDLVLAPTTWIPSLIVNDRLNPVALNNDQFRYESNRLVTYYDPIGKKQTYGYPFYLDTTIMVYNQPIFDNYQVDVSTDTPWSWNLFDYVIRKVTNLTNPNSGIYGTMLAGMMSFEAYFYGNGSHLFNNYLVDSSHIEGDSDHALGVFNFINKLMHTYEVMPDWENQGTLGTVMDLVNQSRVSTVFQPVSLVYPLLNETFVGKAGDLAVMETPENGGALHGQAFLLHAALEEAVKEDLINFCNFMTSSDVQLSLATNGYVAPTLKETYSLSEFNDDPVLKTIKKAIDRAYQKPISLYMHDIEETFQNQVFQFLQGDRSPEQLQTAISILFKQILPETAINDGLPPEEQPITESTTEKKSGFIGLDYWVIIVGIMIMGILTHQYKEKRK